MRAVLEDPSKGMYWVIEEEGAVVAQVHAAASSAGPSDCLGRLCGARGSRYVAWKESHGALSPPLPCCTAAAQLMITFEWSDWRNRAIWWVQSVYVLPSCRRQGRYRALYRAVRAEAVRSGAAGLRLYADSSNIRAQARLGGRGPLDRPIEFRQGG